MPNFLPDVPSVRADLAAQYTAVNRMDRIIEVMIEELSLANQLENTLIIYFSDNGIPFPRYEIIRNMFYSILCLAAKQICSCKDSTSHVLYIFQMRQEVDAYRTSSVR